MHRKAGQRLRHEVAREQRRPNEFSLLGSAALEEEWNSDEVRKLHKHGWTIIDNIAFHNDDVNHVAIGPGGVVILETKWSDYGWHGNVNPIRLAALRKFDRQLQRLEAPANALLKQHGSTARVTGSAIVACGPGRPLMQTRTPGQTRVVPTHQLGDFLMRLPPKLTPEAAAGAAGVIKAFQSAQLERERLEATR